LPPLAPGAGIALRQNPLHSARGQGRLRALACLACPPGAAIVPARGAPADPPRAGACA